MEGWRVASKGLGPLPWRRGSALAHGCDRCGRVVLPLARAAAVSTGLRVPEAEEADAQEVEDGKAEDERVQEGRVLVDEPGEAQAWAWRTVWAWRRVWARLGVGL